MLTELRAAMRSLRRRPLMAVAAVLSLGIGMSLATSVFTMLDALVLHEPFAGAHGLLRVYEQLPGQSTEVAEMPARHLLALRDDSKLPAEVAASKYIDPVVLGSSGIAATVPAVGVTTNYFRTLQVHPVLGRLFDEQDGLRGAPQAVVIGYSVWQSRFGTDSGIVDHPTIINGRAARIIGVMPKDFSFPGTAMVWAPIGEDEIRRVASAPDADWAHYVVVARMSGAANIRSMESEIQSDIDNADVVTHAKQPPRIHLRTLAIAMRRDHATELALWVSLSVVLLFLCAVNFATITLAQGMRRGPEIAVRSALGASARQLAAMFLSETAILGVLSGTLAAFLATWLTELFRLSLPSSFGGDTVHVGWNVVLFGVVGSLVVGVLFTLAPAIQLSRADLRGQLASEGGLAAGRSALNRGRTGLVALQLGLAVLCVSGVLALVRADRKFESDGAGYDARHIVTGSLLIQDSTLMQSSERPLLEFIGSQPGVDAVAVERSPVGFNGAVGLSADTRVDRSAGIKWADVSTDFFATLRVVPLSGRLPSADEIASRAPVAVLSKFAAKTFGATNPIGHRIKMETSGNKAVWLTVIGVVPDIRRGPDFQWFDPPIYTSWDLPLDSTESRIFIRMDGSAAAGVATLRSAFASYDPRLMITDLRTVDTDVAQFSAQARARKEFLGGIAVLSLLLAGVGVYGLTGYAANARAREMSIRLVLGATNTDVIWTVLGDLLGMAAVGAVLGALAAGRFSQLLDAALRNPQSEFVQFVTFPVGAAVMSLILLLVIASAGAYVPIRRVVRQDVARALR